MAATATRELSAFRAPSDGARFGYLVAIVANAGLLWAAESVLRWGVPFVTSDWVDVLWAVRASLVASIAANAIYIAYDAHWFRCLTGMLTTGLALLSMAVTYTVFPFALPSALLEQVVRLAMLAGMLGTVIAIIAQFVHLLMGSAER